MTWKGESRRHSLARRGIKTVIDKDKRFDVSNFVGRGIPPTHEGRLWGDGNRSWDNHLYIVDERDGYIIGAYVSDESVFSEEIDDYEFVEPFIMQLGDFANGDFVRYSGDPEDPNWNLSNDYKNIKADDLKTIDKLFEETEDHKAKAMYGIAMDKQYAQDVALIYGQMYDNIKHTTWFKKALEGELEADFNSEQRWKELKKMRGDE